MSNHIDFEIQDLAERVFRVSKSKGDVISPPDQVFCNLEFDFLFDEGGSLVRNASEFNALMKLLENIGETNFYILENLGATITDTEDPYVAKISIYSSFEEFRKIEKSFNPPFGSLINHFYIFGQNKNWGIYICEYPDINIIGCSSNLKKQFSGVFNIIGNGFEKLESFIDKEISHISNSKAELIKNYKVFNNE